MCDAVQGADPGAAQNGGNNRALWEEAIEKQVIIDEQSLFFIYVRRAVSAIVIRIMIALLCVMKVFLRITMSVPVYRFL